MVLCYVLRDCVGDNENDTPLHVCEKVEIAKILLAHGAELNARNAEGRTVSQVVLLTIRRVHWRVLTIALLPCVSLFV